MYEVQIARADDICVAGTRRYPAARRQSINNRKSDILRISDSNTTSQDFRVVPKSEIKQTASLILWVNRRPNSPVGSKLEQRR